MVAPTIRQTEPAVPRTNGRAPAAGAPDAVRTAVRHPDSAAPPRPVDNHRADHAGTRGPQRTADEAQPVARSETPDARSLVVHVFAGVYFAIISFAWLVAGKVEAAEYFAQSGLILASVGLYHAPPPSSPRRKP